MAAANIAVSFVRSAACHQLFSINFQAKHSVTKFNPRDLFGMVALCENTKLRG